MQEIYKRIDAADILVFGTPVYWFTPSAKMKLLLDRLRPYYRSGRLEGKKMVVLLPAGVGERDCDLSTDMFKRMAHSLKMELVGVVTAKAYDIGDVEKDEKTMEAIADLVKEINAIA